MSNHLRAGAASITLSLRAFMNAFKKKNVVILFGLKQQNHPQIFC
jgi:hypothetical protein